MFVSLHRPKIADYIVFWLQNNAATDFGGGIAFVQSPGVTLTITSSTVSNNKVTCSTLSSRASMMHTALDRLAHNSTHQLIPAPRPSRPMLVAGSMATTGCCLPPLGCGSRATLHLLLPLGIWDAATAALVPMAQQPQVSATQIRSRRHPTLWSQVYCWCL
jgi:hypothetical protein